MQHTSHITLSREALEFNMAFLEKEMGKDVLVSYVVKGNAYGHGIETYAPLAASTGHVKHFSVFSADEAKRLLNCLEQKIPIMIMGFIGNDDLAWAIEHDIEFFVSNVYRLKKAITIARQLHKKALIHIELETGMNRTGLSEADLFQHVFPILHQEQGRYQLKGLCTHFAGAENIANYVRLKSQKEVFSDLRKQFEKQSLYPEYIHTCCSAAAIRFEDMRFNMVRIGILQYGFWPSQEIKLEYLRKHNLQAFNLKRVLTWETEVMSVEEITMGDFIGYGTSYQAAQNMKVGVIPVGYANGYSRALSNSGRVIIHGIRAGVVGTVNMNVLMADLTNIPDVQPGDKVILIGEEGDCEVSVSSFSELSNQLNYELLSRLPLGIPRSVQ